jgi:hypothetical protein
LARPLAELAAEVVTIERVLASPRLVALVAGLRAVEVGRRRHVVPERVRLRRGGGCGPCRRRSRAALARAVPVGSRRDLQLEIVIRGLHGREERPSVPCRFVPLVGEAGFAEHPAR